MIDRAVQARLLPTPFFSSFLGRARPGERLVADMDARAAAWASWALEAATEMNGLADRSYPALVLDGRFYDPKGRGPSVKPHLEVPARVLSGSDPEFPDRLALMGNGLAFPWWVFSEVKAVRRALFNTPASSIAEATDLLGRSRDPLVAALEALGAVAAPSWSVIEGLLVTRDDGLSVDATADFSADEVAAYFPAGAALHLKVSYDAALSESNGRWASRRVGVWQISGVADGETFAFGVLTPRLTANSLFMDPLFAPGTEAPGALLVRGLLLDRLVRGHLNDEVSVAVGAPVAGTDGTGSGPHLRTIVAQVGKKLPEASIAAAVHFLQHFGDGESAWAAISGAAGRSGTILTVTKDGFLSAHANALRFLRRAEEPERDDINVVLPLGWDEKSRVVRYTFSLPERDDSGETAPVA